jgi:chromosomal replication initiator protein
MGGEKSSKMNSVWPNARLLLEQGMDKGAFNWHIASLQAEVAGDQLCLKAQDQYAMLLIQNYHLKTITDAVLASCRELNIEDCKLSLSAKDSVISCPLTSEKPARVESTALNKRKTKSENDDEFGKYLQPLNPWNTFDNFIVADSNRNACMSCQDMVKGVDVGNNFMLLHSPTGLGKTHLAQAACAVAAANNQIFAYQNAQDFGSYYSSTVRNRKFDDFHKNYRSVNIFIVEDLPFFKNKEGYQQAIRSIIEYMINKNGKVILTTNAMPKEILKLSEDFKSLLESAVIVKIAPPSFETKLAILRKLNEIRKYEISDDVLETVAHNCSQNIKSLFSSLYSLAAMSVNENKVITPDMAKEFLDYLNKSIETEDALDFIKSQLCSIFGKPLEELLSDSRAKDIKYPRNIGMYLARTLYGYSYPQIASAFNKKVHTTAMNAYKKISDELPKNAKLRQQVDYVAEQVVKKYPIDKAAQADVKKTA